MAIRKMRYDGDETLRQKCKEVTEVNDRIRMYLDDMLDTLHATENGAAIAANQVGILRRLVVIDYCNVVLKLVNPVIVEKSGTQECMEALHCTDAAGCLAGAMFACLACPEDFDAAIITAINHSGMSSAVGAITGAILGAKMGEDALPDFYMESLEPVELLREIADDLSQISVIHQRSRLYDDDWDRKYLHASF